MQDIPRQTLISALVPPVLFVYFQVSRERIVASVEPHDEEVIEYAAAADVSRTLEGAYPNLKKTLKILLRRLDLLAWYKPQPRALFHMLTPVDGGYTPVEKKAFCNVALDAGCSELWFLGPEESVLSKEKLAEVRSAVFEPRPWWRAFL